MDEAYTVCYDRYEGIILATFTTSLEDAKGWAEWYGEKTGTHDIYINPNPHNPPKDLKTTGSDSIHLVDGEWVDSVTLARRESGME